MKTSHDIALKLRRQWFISSRREHCLLDKEVWPMRLAIGKPGADIVSNNIQALRQHIQHWRKVTCGRVIWEFVNYRALPEAIEIPVSWSLQNPSDWVAAMEHADISGEYRKLGQVVAGIDAFFHRPMIRYRHLLVPHSPEVLLQVVDAAAKLEPGCGDGKPLRALSVCGNDSKFFERYRQLLIRLLDWRFDQAVSDVGLEAFLGASFEGDQWLLVAPLADGLFPFKQLRLRAGELASKALPASHIVIVENEQCLHQLPVLEDTIAILGAGLNLNWLGADWLSTKKVAYWGDIDTWGLKMLAIARELQPQITAMLMDLEVFSVYRNKLAVEEPKPADEKSLQTLSMAEQQLFQILLKAECGRLEQEFLPQSLVADAFVKWHG